VVRPIAYRLGSTASFSLLIVFQQVEGICLSHAKVKQAVGFVIGFVFTIVSASCCFLYL